MWLKLICRWRYCHICLRDYFSVQVFILPCILIRLYYVSKLFFSWLGSYSSKASLRSPPKAGPVKNRSRPDGSTEYPSWVSGLGKEYPSWVEDLDTTGRHRKIERYSNIIYNATNLGHSPVKIYQAAAQFRFTCFVSLHLYLICMNHTRLRLKEQRRACYYKLFLQLQCFFVLVNNAWKWFTVIH